MGVTIDGIPSNFPIDTAQIENMLKRRRPGFSKLHSARCEEDLFEIISGLSDGRSTGAPLTFIIRNTDARSADYEKIKDIFRPGHADFCYHHKYDHYDHRGGGRSSGRETIARVIAGAVAGQFLHSLNISIQSRIIQIGQRIISGPDAEAEIAQEIMQAKENKDSIGGRIEIRADNLPPVIGEPVYEKLNARLAFGLMSINGVKGVEIGSADEAAGLCGSEYNDAIHPDGFQTNHCGGILGGIANGQPLLCRISIKPTPSIGKTQQTINKQGESVSLQLQGRHDPCILPRALVVAESMVACVIFDLLLLHRTRNWNQNP
jgi:chorismate synthase